MKRRRRPPSVCPCCGGAGTLEPLTGYSLVLLRKELGLSQGAMADVLGISPSYLSNLEHEHRHVTTEIRIKYNEIFGIDIRTP